jgi:hypothetical protein
MRSLWLLSAVLAAPLAAQVQPLATAAATITAPDLLGHIQVIAADSMQGRATPSPELERTAEYVTSEFRRFGLQPAGEDGSYLQRFGVTRWTIDTAASVVELAISKTRDVARFGKDARYILGKIPDSEITAPAILISPGDSQRSLVGPDVQGKVVLLLADFSKPLPLTFNERVTELSAAGPKAVLVLSNRDSLTFTQRLRLAARPRLERNSLYGQESGAPVIELHERAVSAVLGRLKLDPARLRQLPEGVRRPIPGLQVALRLSRKVLNQSQVPNVVALLQGSDPVLKNEFLVYSAHIDHIGISSGQVDSVNNGADDNASGVAGLLELAAAFARGGVRPRRSILFLAPSGEEDGLLGSAHFTEHPTVPLSQIVANVNMDLVGRNWTDSVIAVGLEQTDLGTTLRAVSDAHPELRMTPIADRWPEERIFYRSDHYNFARKGVPILFFTSGTHPDYHQPSDEASRIDSEKEARLVRLLFYLGARVADTVPRPRWNVASYRQIVEGK